MIVDKSSLIWERSRMPRKTRTYLSSCKRKPRRWRQRNAKTEEFSKKETLMLLGLWQENRDKRVAITQYQSDAYKKVSCVMKNIGYNLSPTQCFDKVYILYHRYKVIKANISKTGGIATEWEYYEIMTDFLNDRLVTPQPQNYNPQGQQQIKSEVMESLEEHEEIESCRSETGWSQVVVKKEDDESEDELEMLKQRQAENNELLRALIEKVH